jgi:uncharacterized membrane protein YoaK (UPF0700 family)
MTGNTVAAGIGVAQSNWEQVFRRGAVIPVFICGMLFSKCGIYTAERRRFDQFPALLYALEALLLGVFMLLGQRVHLDRLADLSLLDYLTLVSFPSFAMGLQNALHTHFGPFNLHTTHVTGTLARLADEFAQFLIWFRERTRHAKPNRLKRVILVCRREQKLRNVIALASVWVFYATGALIGALLKENWHLVSLLCPISVLLAFTGIVLWNPAVLWPVGRAS